MDRLRNLALAAAVAVASNAPAHIPAAGITAAPFHGGLEATAEVATRLIRDEMRRELQAEARAQVAAGLRRPPEALAALDGAPGRS